MDYQNKIWVFDDIIDKNYQDEIENILVGRDSGFSWYFIPEVAPPLLGEKTTVTGRPAMSHSIVNRDGQNSNFHEFIRPMVEEACKRTNNIFSVFSQGRTFLQFPLNIKDRHILDELHVDNRITPHLVVLYYVIDADGDTIIYENHYSNEKSVPEHDKRIIKKKVTPKKGRIVLFDGWYWHTAEQPTNSNRCIINYNVM